LYLNKITDIIDLTFPAIVLVIKIKIYIKFEVNISQSYKVNLYVKISSIVLSFKKYACIPPRLKINTNLLNSGKLKYILVISFDLS